MSPVDYFKLQAKNLLKDYKTQTSDIDQADGITHFTYSPTYFDIDRIFLEYDWDEENFSLMKAQHFFALMLGFDKWGDLIDAPSSELELAKLVWDNQHKIHLEDWNDYIAQAEDDNTVGFGPEERIDIFRQVFVEVDGHHSPFGDYRLKR
jgi:hypothetical protein